MADRKNNNVVEDLKSLSKLGGDGALRDSHSYPGHYIRTKESLTVVKDFYDSFDVTYANDLPTEVCYYAGTAPHLTTIACKSDVLFSLQSTYFFMYAAQANTKFYIWYNVDGLGVDPAIANSIGIEVPLASNDDKTIVANATQLILNMSVYKTYFNITRTGSILTIANTHFGPISDTVDNDTTFVFDNTSGARELVEKVNLMYNGSNPIYNGQELIDYRYNIYKSTFEFRSSGATTIEDSDGDKLEINTNGSINTVVARDFDRYEADYNPDDSIEEVRYYLGVSLIRTVNITYDGNGNIIGYVES